MTEDNKQEAPREVLEELINVLRATTASQQLEIADLKAWIQVYQSRLKKYEAPSEE